MLLAADQVSTVAAERGIGFGRDLPARSARRTVRHQRRAVHRRQRRRPTTRACVLSPTRQGRWSRRPGRTTCISRSAACCGASTTGNCGRRWSWCPIRLTTRARQQSYRIETRRIRCQHTELLPAGEAPAGARAARSRPCPAGRGRSGIDLDGALQAMRVALADAGLPFRVEASAEIAVLQFAKYRLWKDLADHWPDLIAQPAGRPSGALAVRAVRRPGARTPRMTTWTSWPRPARFRPMPRSRGGRRGDGRPDVRPRGPAREPASRRPSPTCWPGPSPTAGGCCSSPRNAPRSTSSRRRLDAIGLGSVLPGPARQVQQADGGPRADPGRPGPPGGRRPAGTGGDRRGPAGGPRPARPVCHQRCTSRTAPGCRSTRRARRCWRSATMRRVLPIPAGAAGCFARSQTLAGVRRSADHRRRRRGLGRAPTRSPLGVRRLS